MATSANQDAKRGLSSDDRKLIDQALAFYYKSSIRAANTATDEVLKNHHQTKGYAIQSLANRLKTTELDL